MKPEDFTKSTAGQCIKTPQGYWAFVPKPLPPKIDYPLSLVNLLSDAERALGELSGMGRLLPNPHLLIHPCVRREAVLSSRIEGTQASLDDLFLFEAVPSRERLESDVRELHNYVSAMEYGLERVKELPISCRLVQEIHKCLVEGVRGSHSTPGEFRTRQNWIGPPGCLLNQATFVPPPVQEMKDAMSDWEKYLHSEPSESPLVQCALMHYQFEAIHPFVDGNGRVGRLLITFFLCERGYLPQPLLYLSAYFERNRAEYYDRLLRVSTVGDWHGWLEFFLRGVATQAKDAIDWSAQLMELHEKYRQRLLGRKVPKGTHGIVDELFVNPYVTITAASERWDISYPTARSAIEKLAEHNILEEVTGRKRDRVYCAKELLGILSGPER